jgi:hypothetical protein
MLQQLQIRVTGSSFYDFKNIFVEKIGEQIGDFDTYKKYFLSMTNLT